MQDYFKYILKTHEEKKGISSVRIYVNKIENRITFKIKTGYHIQLLTLGTMKLPVVFKGKTTREENGGNVLHLKITEVILLHCNIFNNDYQHGSRILYKLLVPNKSFGQLLHISPKGIIVSKNWNSEFSYIKLRFNDQLSKPLEIKDKINITFVVN